MYERLHDQKAHYKTKIGRKIQDIHVHGVAARENMSNIPTHFDIKVLNSSFEHTICIIPVHY